MNHITYFDDFYESIPDYRKNKVLMFISKKDDDLPIDYGLLKNDKKRLY